MKLVEVAETKRAKIPTGLKCNMRCKFCYYIEHLDDENPSTRKMKLLISQAYERGMKDIDFSGGESTIRGDFIELVHYAKKLGFRNICVITNGLRMANKDYTKKLVEAGLNEVLFSIHGNREIHDYLTQIPGSFDKLMKAIENVRELNVRFRTNTTINKMNYKILPELTELFLSLKPAAVNFILFNPHYSPESQLNEMICKYSECFPYIRKSVDDLKTEIKKVTVRFIPFCFMENYEKYVCDRRQRKYDCDEWLPRVQAKIEEVSPIRHFIYGFIDLIHKNIPKNKKINDLLDKFVQWTFTTRYFVKPSMCDECKYRLICDGIKKGYARIFGLEEIKAIKGELIKNPVEFRGNYGNYGN